MKTKIRRTAIVAGGVGVLFVSYFVGQAIGEFYNTHVVDKFW